MANLNKVFLMGNLTADPELRYTPKGTAVTDIRLAINRYYAGDNSERQEETTFVDVTLWNRQAEVAGNYLSKGRGVFVEGRLQLDSWEDKASGQKRTKLRVIGENIQLFPRGGEGDMGGAPRQQYQNAPRSSNYGQSRPAPNYNPPPCPPPISRPTTSETWTTKSRSKRKYRPFLLQAAFPPGQAAFLHHLPRTERLRRATKRKSGTASFPAMEEKHGNNRTKGKTSPFISAWQNQSVPAYWRRMKIAVIGKGGREHALVKALKESPSAPEMYCFPGSDAINRLATPIPARDLPSLIDWMVSNKMDLCVAGEESYLVKDEGLANACSRAGIPCWGPVKESAQLEASKEFAKDFLLRHRIPTGQARVAATLEEARQFIGNNYPTVLKFDGLAAGKGVAVCMSKEEADSFLKEVFTDRRFGEGRLLVEEFLTGPEVSIFGALVDDHYLILCPARDYKRLKEGDAGPNTGGMGAVASRRLVEPEMLERIEKGIVAPTVAGLKKDGLPYRGFLYFGLMLTPNGPKVIEYNCRFGDPECQAVMPLLSGDLASFCLHGAKGEFAPEEISFQNGWSVCCVLASKGYPETSHSGDAIQGLDDISNASVYHAGTKWNADKNCYETNGGRVLAVVAQGDTLSEARQRAHNEIKKIQFNGMQRRPDIGFASFV